MFNSPLEFLAQKYGNVVKYDADGNPSIFVKFMKMKSSDLVTGLPDHTHPAFIINGVEQDYILLGKYKAGAVSEAADSALVSAPNIRPIRSLGADQILERIRKGGNGISGMTVADYGFIKLLAQKNGWKPRGNTLWGQSHSDGTNWAVGQSVAKDNERAFEGYIYKCLIAHSTVAELRPDLAPSHWLKGRYIGGISSDDARDANTQTGYRTLNGSGPLDWYLGEDAGNLADIIGSSLEQQYGYRIVDCELQILENNNAAAPDADLSDKSAAWKAILPNKSNDSYTLVAPGTVGTLHWNFKDTKITLDTQCDDFSIGPKGQSFTTIAVNAEHLPFVPSIVKELGLVPTGPEDKTEGYYWVNFAKGEFFPRRGGGYSGGASAGLGYVYSGDARGHAGAGYGGRSRSLP